MRILYLMIQKGIHILLSTLVLASTFGAVINKHYCQDELKEISFFFESHKCQPAAIDSCHQQPSSSDTKGIDKDYCCTYQSEFYQVDFQQEALANAQLEKHTDIFFPLFIAKSDSFDVCPALIKIRPPPYSIPLIPSPDQPDLQVFLC